VNLAQQSLALVAAMAVQAGLFLSLLSPRRCRGRLPTSVSPEDFERALPQACEVWTMLGRPIRPRSRDLAMILASEASRRGLDPSQCVASLTRSMRPEEVLQIWKSAGASGLSEALGQELDRQGTGGHSQ